MRTTREVLTNARAVISSENGDVIDASIGAIRKVTTGDLTRANDESITAFRALWRVIGRSIDRYNTTNIVAAFDTAIERCPED